VAANQIAKLSPEGWRVVKDKWYGDNRDLVKWGALLLLANRFVGSRIVQVACYRPETIEIDGVRHLMPDAVISHFSRSLKDIARLNSPCVQIEVFDLPFLDRDEYMQGLQASLANLISSGSPCIVFLDPDTGLEPMNKHELEHVLESELAQIWSAMRADDVLVFYQHKTDRKRGTSWIDPKRKQFEKALGLPIGAAKMARGETATDVVFFFAQKGSQNSQT